MGGVEAVLPAPPPGCQPALRSRTALWPPGGAWRQGQLCLEGPDAVRSLSTLGRMEGVADPSNHHPTPQAPHPLPVWILLAQGPPPNPRLSLEEAELKMWLCLQSGRTLPSVHTSEPGEAGAGGRMYWPHAPSSLPGPGVHRAERQRPRGLWGPHLLFLHIHSCLF